MPAVEAEPRCARVAQWLRPVAKSIPGAKLLRHRQSGTVTVGNSASFGRIAECEAGAANCFYRISGTSTAAVCAK